MPLKLKEKNSPKGRQENNKNITIHSLIIVIIVIIGAVKLEDELEILSVKSTNKTIENDRSSVSRK